ncbi:FAD-dependent oxidoreductase, partial [Desulfovibrio sp. OttesenSCG-928-C14]|nr:FAD-dependent oxidoreductase [Desulfovibrio sp. OttesenSCG-928-C14]
FQIGNLTIKNRFCMGPMGGSQLPFGPKGELNDIGIEYYVERARGGFGLLYIGAMHIDMEVDRFDKINELSPMYSPFNFKRTAMTLVDRLRAYNAKVIPQITLGLGRNYPDLLSPSELPMFWDPSVKSTAISKDQLKRKVELLVQGAKLMQDCGFDGVEVHALHWGYLLDQFAMSVTNQREDEYGGSLENRLRVTRECLDGIKAVCGQSFPVTVRLGLKSYMKGFNRTGLNVPDAEDVGRTLEEGVRICKLLEEYGYDGLSVDAGVYDSFYHAAPPMYMPKGHCLDLAAAAKKEVAIPVLTGSRMGDPYLCEEGIATGKTDAVVLSRPTLADPHFAKKVEMGVPEKIRPCIACNSCLLRTVFTGGGHICAVNPSTARKLTYGPSKALTPKKVAVVGGGVAGMEAARSAKLRGHSVHLYEKSDSLGGHLLSGGAHEFKKDVADLNAWYQRALADLDVPVHMNTEVSAEMLKKSKVDAVILATGSLPIMPGRIPGIDHPKVCSCTDALLGRKKIGQKVVVVGGGLVGCEMALELAREGKSVTVVEALDKLMTGGDPPPFVNSMMLIDLLKENKVEIITGSRLDSVNDAGATIMSCSCEEKREIPADSVIISIGFRPVESLAEKLYGTGIEVYQAGDANRIGSIRTAVSDAYEIARGL